MRDDFKKVLCEEPRYRGWRNRGKALNKRVGYKKKAQKASLGDYDEWNFPKKESMFGRGHRGDKEFGEHLGPLVRFLRSSVGRKWDEVYSEIAKTCPNNGAVNAHIYQHLWQYVERNAVFIDGKPYDSTYGWKRELMPVEDRGHDNTFYVDLKGFLRRAPRLEKVKPKATKEIHKAGGKIYLKVQGIWYEGIFRPIPKKQLEMVEYTNTKGVIREMEVKKRPKFSDSFVGSLDYWHWHFAEQRRLDELVKRCFKAYGKKIYCYDMKQLSSKELRRLDLENDKNNTKK